MSCDQTNPHFKDGALNKMYLYEKAQELAEYICGK
jgi:hypothetical protein